MVIGHVDFEFEISEEEIKFLIETIGCDRKEAIEIFLTDIDLSTASDCSISYEEENNF